MAGLWIEGKVVFVKQEEMGEKKTPVKKLQLMANGGEQRACLFDVTDMKNEAWDYGADVRVPVSCSGYVPKKGGVNISYTYWGGRLGGTPEQVPAVAGKSSGLPSMGK